MRLELDEIHDELVTIACELQKISAMKQAERGYISQQQAKERIEAIEEGQGDHTRLKTQSINEVRRRQGLEPLEGELFDNVPGVLAKRILIDQANNKSES